MKGVFVIMDGVADEPNSALKGKTPLEVAKTPNLDWFASRAKLDYCHTVKEDVAPESSSAVISLLGYDPNFISRGVLEAIGAGVDVRTGDLVFRTNFGTIDSLKEGNVLDRRAGRTLSTNEARTLTEAVNDKLRERFGFKLYSTIQHRGVLVFKGGFSDNISNVDPHYANGAVSSSSKLEFSQPMDDEDDSRLSADIVNSFVRHSHEVLDHHPVNIDRARKGLFSANFIFCRGPGSKVIKFRKLNGKWLALGYMPLEKGIAKVTGMEVYSFKYPKMKGIDVYKNLFDGLNLATKYARRMIWWKAKKFDYFYVHFKETDVPGHDGNVMDKIKMIEYIDQNFFGFLRKFIGDAKLIVCADHTTSCRQKKHTDQPVPVLTYPHPSGKEVEGQRYTEEFGRTGRKIMGRKLLEENFF